MANAPQDGAHCEALSGPSELTRGAYCNPRSAPRAPLRAVAWRSRLSRGSRRRAKPPQQRTAVMASPRERGLRIKTLEVPDERHWEVHAGCDPRSTHAAGVVRPAMPVYVFVEVRLAQKPIQLLRGCLKGPASSRTATVRKRGFAAPSGSIVRRSKCYI